MVGWEGERVRLKWGSWAQGLSGRLGVGFALGSRVGSIRKFPRFPFPGLDFIPDYSARSSRWSSPSRPPTLEEMNRHFSRDLFVVCGHFLLAFCFL
jgi:hypothetical protein